MSLPRYPKYTGSGIECLGKMPAHWNVVQLKHLCGICYGIGEPPSYHETGTPLIRATNVHAGSISAKGLVFVDPSEIPEQRIVWLDEGDIIVVRSGAYTGDSAIIPTRFPRSIAGFDMVIKCHSAQPQFVQYVLLSTYFKEGQIDLEKMRAAQPHLNSEELGSCRVALPTSEEQAIIVEFLDREISKIDALVAEQERLMELLKEKRQAVISHAVTKGLNPRAPMKDSGIEWLGEVPAHWNVIRLANVFREVGEPGHEGLPILSVSIHHGVSDKEMAEEELDRKVTRSEDRSKYIRVAPGDLVYNMMRAWQGGFGTVIVEGMVSPAYVVARPRKPIETKFVEYLLRTPQAIEQMRRHSQGVTDFRLRLYWDEFKNIRISLPPPDEAREICRHIEATEATFGDMSSESEKLVALLLERRTALISAAVTGQIDVRSIKERRSAA